MEYKCFIDLVDKDKLLVLGTVLDSARQGLCSNSEVGAMLCIMLVMLHVSVAVNSS